jgi:hypothetical protein
MHGRRRRELLFLVMFQNLCSATSSQRSPRVVNGVGSRVSRTEVSSAAPCRVALDKSYLGASLSALIICHGMKSNLIRLAFKLLSSHFLASSPITP